VVLDAIDLKGNEMITDFLWTLNHSIDVSFMLENMNSVKRKSKNKPFSKGKKQKSLKERSNRRKAKRK